MILFLMFLNILLPIIGYGIAGNSSMICMIIVCVIVDLIAINSYLKSRIKIPKQQYGRNANHYMSTDKE